MVVIQYEKLSQHPSPLPNLYARSMQWKTAVNDVPTGLQPVDFEDWLRRRKSANKKKHNKKAKNHDNKIIIPVLLIIGEIMGKGQGVVASTKIAKGARILAESQLFTVSRTERNIKDLEASTGRQVQSLGEKQIQLFFALHDCHGNRHPPELGICKTNVLPLGTDAIEGGLFLQASRIKPFLPDCSMINRSSVNQMQRKFCLHCH